MNRVFDHALQVAFEEDTAIFWEAKQVISCARTGYGMSANGGRSRAAANDSMACGASSSPSGQGRATPARNVDVGVLTGVLYCRSSPASGNMGTRSFPF